MAVELTKRVARSGCKEIGGITYHVAAFEKTRRDAAICSALLFRLRNVKGVMFFSDGLMVQEHVDVRLVLDCYAKSFLARSDAAYCTTIIDDPALQEPYHAGYVITINPVKHTLTEIEQFSFPCKHVWQSIRLQAQHQASYQDQIQAVAVENMAHICPRFDPDNFKSVGFRPAIVPEDY